MRLLIRVLTSRLSVKIILPYLLLALCLAVTMTFVAVRFTAGALQERVDNRLVEAAQVTSDSLVSVEEEHLVELRQMAFTEGVAEAIANGDRATLASILRPYWTNTGRATLIVFDRDGQPLLSWERADGDSSAASPQVFAADGVDGWWMVAQIVAGRSDAFGDKFSAFKQEHLFTAAPVRKERALVGGIMVGTPLDQLLDRLQMRSQATVTTFYDSAGRAVATTQLILADNRVPSIPANVLTTLQSNPDKLKPFHVQDVISLNEREYQFAYSPLQIRRATNGYFSVGLSRQFITDSWASQRLPLVGLALLLVLAVVSVGFVVSRHITTSLGSLVHTARAVSRGELGERSSVTSRDELGVVAASFNHMTERLLHLYQTSRELSAQTETSAILAQTTVALQRLIPINDVVALLRDGDAWSCHVAAESTALQPLRHVSIASSPALLALAEQSHMPLVVSSVDPRLPDLPALSVYPQLCCVALHVQGELIGLLLLCRKERDTLSPTMLAPVAAISSMAATALHNTQLYQKVQEEGIRRQVILESIADSVVVCDAQRRVVLMNHAAEKLLNVHDWADRRLHFSELPLHALNETKTLLTTEGQQPMRYEAHGRILSASSAGWAAAASGAAGEVIVLHDISTEVALDQAKTDLIAMISHELRTPLTGILGAVDLLVKGYGGQLSALQTELANAALRQSRAMSALIDKAVMVANIETGQLHFTVQPTYVRDIVEAATKDFVRNAASNVQVTFDVDDDVPPVMVDPQKIRIVLEQLIDNALKYGGGEPVEVIVRREDEDVLIGVRDYGIGMAPEQVRQVFGRLNRSADSSNTAQRGLGLGLVIARALIERQGGTINVESKLGEGSFFWVTVRETSDVAELLVA